jgi:hypothetical protein
MTIGFDLTQFGAYPTKRPVGQPAVATPVAPAPPQPTPAIDPNAPTSIREALTKPLDGQVVDEEGHVYEDKLAKNAPALKKSLWGIDKFASSVRPIQIMGKNNKMIWIDGNGNNILDPETGEILTKPPASTDEDRQNINFHGEPASDTLNEIK